MSSVPLEKPLRIRPNSLSSSLAGEVERLNSSDATESSGGGGSNLLDLNVSPNGGRSVRRGEPRMLRDPEMELI